MTSVQQLAEQEAFQSASLSILFNRLTRVATWSCLTYSGLMLFIDGDPMRILATMIIAIGGPLSNLLRRTTNTRWGFSVYLWSIFWPFQPSQHCVAVWPTRCFTPMSF